MAAARIGLIAALLLACGPSPTAVQPPAVESRPHPWFPREAVITPFRYPAIYRLVWADLEMCTGLRTEDIDDWSFWSVQGETFRLTGEGDKQYLGFAVSHPVRRIYLAEGARMTPRVIRHEMLHALGAWDEASPLFGLCEEVR